MVVAKTLKAGVIGCGAVAQALHMPGYMRCPGVSLEAACDPVRRRILCRQERGQGRGRRDEGVELTLHDVRFQGAPLSHQGEAHEGVSERQSGIGVNGAVHRRNPSLLPSVYRQQHPPRQAIRFFTAGFRVRLPTIDPVGPGYWPV